MSDVRTVETEAEAEGDDKAVQAIWDELTTKPDLEETPPGKDDKLEPKPEDGPKVEAPAAADSLASDPWKDAPPALREAHERDLAEIRTRAEQAEITARRHSGRLSKQEQELADLRAKVAPKADATGDDKAKTRAERMEQLRGEYPEIAEPLLEDLADKEARLERIEGALSQQAQSHSNDLADEQVSILAKADPNWATEIKDNPKFVEWAIAQPEYIKGVIRENAKAIISGDDVADVIARYRRDTADPERERAEARRKEQLDAGRGADVRNPGLAAPKGDGTVEQTWEELAEQRRRKEAGNRR